MSSRWLRRERAIFFMRPMRDRIVWRHHSSLTGPSRGVVVPELLEGFLEKVGTDGLEVVAEQISEPEMLFVLEISLRLSSSQRDFLRIGLRPSRCIRPLSSARTLSSALFILETMWKRSRTCRASEHLSRMSFRYGSHMSEQTKQILEMTSWPMAARIPGRTQWSAPFPPRADG